MSGLCMAAQGGSDKLKTAVASRALHFCRRLSMISSPSRLPGALPAPAFK